MAKSMFGGGDAGRTSMESCRHRIQSDGGVIPASAKQGALRRASLCDEAPQGDKGF
ncbi:hypothetical protein [Sphingobacterium griseoflavum]|uniref:hypothetical protein n=1 Tax=Sphingobacterium griseoflavum TaxID=1474952 RepID=UPI0036423967